MGVSGFRALLARAVILAKREAPDLSGVKIHEDGSFDGLAEARSDEAAEAYAFVFVQLLGLLVTFIGEPLTLKLVRDLWPDVPPAERTDS